MFAEDTAACRKVVVESRVYYRSGTTSDTGVSAADIRARQPFAHQDRPNVTAARFEDAASTTVVATACALSARWARTADDLKIQPAACDKASQSSCCASCKATLAFAPGLAARLRGVKSDKPDCLSANADGVTVDHLHRPRRDGFGSCRCCQGGENKNDDR